MRRKHQITALAMPFLRRNHTQEPSQRKSRVSTALIYCDRFSGNLEPLVDRANHRSTSFTLSRVCAGFRFSTHATKLS